MFHDGWRAAGLLMHPSALFSQYGIGDLGPGAHSFIRFLKKAGFHFWQVLPLTPTSPCLGNSPYSAFSAFAGNPLLVSPELMVRDGWLGGDEVRQAEVAPADGVDFEKVIGLKSGLIDLAFERAEKRLEHHSSFQSFCWEKGSWLNDYAFFVAAKKHFGGGSWVGWPEGLVRRDDDALRHWGSALGRSILKEKFAQYLFFSQLGELKALMADAGLGLIGDAAIYVNHDSSDVWSQPWLFQLDEKGRPLNVAGVPPDYFSKDGQLWGNPLFRWEIHADSGYNWWKHRLWYMLNLYDWVRLDHFRAFAAYWEVPATAETAAFGRWRTGPGADLFEAASERGPLNIVAEDLGLITHDVTALRLKFGYPGMRVLQFAFGPEMGINIHAPYRIEVDNVVYAATHDNNTTRGWYRQEADELVKKQLSDLCGPEVGEDEAAWALIRLAWLSPGFLAVATAQDLLNLDERARFNTPGTAIGNWAWRLSGPDRLNDFLADKVAELGALSGRDNHRHPNTLTY